MKIQVSQYKASISNKTEIKLIMGQETTWTKRAETTRMEMTRCTSKFQWGITVTQKQWYCTTF